MPSTPIPGEILWTLKNPILRPTGADESLRTIAKEVDNYVKC